MHRFRLAVGLAALAAGLVVTPASAAPGEVAVYELDEAPGAAVMLDSSGNGLDGRVGDGDPAAEVKTGVVHEGATGYRFAWLRPNTEPAYPEHNVLVPHSEKLNPGTTDFSVKVRYRTTNSFGNLIQKGQSATRGGYFKIQLPQGEPSCLFRDGAGVTNAVRAATRIDDGAWHTVECLHTAGAEGKVQLLVDGVLVGTNRGAIGSIGNDEPLSLGGKNTCDQITVTCDYFAGDVDWVRITRPSAAVEQPPTAFFPAPVCTDLTCEFDGSGSTDPEGTPLTYDWTFPGATAQGQKVSHTFTSGGIRSVTLRVTDAAGLSDSITKDVTVGSGTSGVAFRDAASRAGTLLSPSVTTPATVVAGDALVAYLSVNRTTSVADPAGWSRISTQSGPAGEPMTHVWHRTATAEDAGKAVKVTLGIKSKFALTVAAYSGVDPVAPVQHSAAESETVYQATHRSPAVPEVSGPDRLLSWWTDKTAGSTGWTAPAGSLQRAHVVGAGTGRVNALLTESDSGTGGLVATSAAASKKAVSWSIVLNGS